jgi:hypothetical protein
MASPTLHRAIAASVATVVVACGLTSCFFAEPPPEGSEESLAELADRIAAVEGVASVETRLQQRDAKDDPFTWDAYVEVTADGPDLAVATLVDGVVGDGVTGTTLDIDLDVPGGPGLAPVTVDPTSEVQVGLAGDLRGESTLASVDTTRYAYSAVVAPGNSFADAAAAVQPHLGTAGPTFALHLDQATTTTSVPSSVALGPTSPAPTMLATIDAVLALDGVTGLAFIPGDVTASSRPSLDVSTYEPDTVLAVLRGAADEQADAGVARRTEFWVRKPRATTPETGWIGLPIGAPEPDDGPEPQPGDIGESPFVNEGPLAELPEQEAAVRAYVEASVAATGVPAEVETRRELCETEYGTRVVGSVLVPVFTVHDDAQGPFDAVVDGWSADGFHQAGRAMGRDYWSAPPGRPDGIESASIRGTADGLSFGVQTGCLP